MNAAFQCDTTRKYSLIKPHQVTRESKLTSARCKRRMKFKYLILLILLSVVKYCRCGSSACFMRSSRGYAHSGAVFTPHFRFLVWASNFIHFVFFFFVVVIIRFLHIWLNCYLSTFWYFYQRKTLRIFRFICIVGLFIAVTVCFKKFVSYRLMIGRSPRYLLQWSHLTRNGSLRVAAVANCCFRYRKRRPTSRCSLIILWSAFWFVYMQHQQMCSI